MGYLDAITSASFKTSEDGRKLFYPWGILGHGYIIPSEEEYKKLLRTYKSIWVIFFIILLVGVLFMFLNPIITMLFTLVAFSAYLIGFIFWLYRKYRKFEKSDVKMSYGEALKNESRHMSTGLMWFFEIICIIFALYGLVLLLSGSSQWLLALALIAIFSFCAVIYARMIINKKRDRAVPK